MRVLVTGADSAVGGPIVRQLVERGISVVGTDSKQIQGVEVVSAVPAGDPGRLSSLRRIAATARIDAVIPTVRAELPQLAAAKSAFPGHVHLVVANPGAAVIADDKLYTAWQLQARGVRVPRFGPVSDFPDARSAFEAIGEPVIARRRVSDGTHQIQFATDPSQLDWETLHTNHFLQHVVMGAQYSVIVYRPQARKGGRPIAVALEKTEVPGAPAPKTLVRRVADGAGTEIARVGVAAVRALGLTGPAEVAVRRAADGSPQVLKVVAGFSRHSAHVPELLDQVLEAAAQHQSVEM